MRRSLIVPALALVAAGAALGGGGATAPADAATSLTRLPGFPAGAVMTRFAKPSGVHESFSSPAVGDITGDGRPEVVSGAPDGVVRVWSDAGRLVLAHDTGGGAVQASPVLADVTGDGVADVVTANTTGEVEAFTAGGRTVFSRRDCGPNGPGLCAVFGTPAVADLTGDGIPEIVAAGWDAHVHAWHLDGRRVAGWPVHVHDTVWASPVVADVTGDGRPEVILGVDCDGVAGQPCAPQRGGYVWVLGPDGRERWKRFVDQVVWSTPAVADLDGDGGLDIVVGSGLHFPAPRGQWVQAFRGDGSPLPGWPQPTDGRVMGSPAVGDLDGDGRPEVAAMAEGGRLVVWSGAGARRWDRCVSSSGQCRPGLPLHGSVAIADVDGDGANEVVSMGEAWLRVLDGRTGAVEAQVAEPQAWPAAGAPAVASIGGRATIVVAITREAGGDPSSPGDGDRHEVLAYTTGQPLGSAPWPGFMAGPARRSTLPVDPALARGSVERLYRAYYLRAPDAGGLQHWLGQLTSGVRLSVISDFFAAAPEFRARYGALGNGDFVRLVYRNVLGREPEAAGFAHWVRTLDSGALTRGGVMLGFSESAEFKAKTGTR